MRPKRCAPDEIVTTRSVTMRQQQAGQREVAEVVGAELQLEAVGGAARDRHHAGVVDQDVEVALQLVGEPAHRREVGEVEAAHVEVAVQLGDRVLPFAVSRHATTTRAPAAPSARAASRPMPLFAPVTTNVRPPCDSMLSVVHFMGPIIAPADVAR